MSTQIQLNSMSVDNQNERMNINVSMNNKAVELQCSYYKMVWGEISEDERRDLFY
jgi:hypothetical protein